MTSMRLTGISTLIASGKSCRNRSGDYLFQDDESEYTLILRMPKNGGQLYCGFLCSLQHPSPGFGVGPYTASPRF